MIPPLLFSLMVRSHAVDAIERVIERAQAAALKKDRAGATRLLREALGSTSARPNRARLRESLQQLARVFFTDQGQRAFETGRAARFDSVDAALENFRTALRLEDGNVTVRLALATALLARDDCAHAREQIAAARALEPFDAEAATLELRALICDHDAGALREKIRVLPPLDKWQDSFVAYVQAREALRQGLASRAAEGFARVTADYSRFPEAHYYLARAVGEGTGEDALRKYVGLCKALTARDRREFALEPRLCAHQKEAEDELAKKAVDL